MSNPAEKSPDEKLGAFIARVREERGMSVEELSAATKVSVAYIKSIEAGDWKAFPVAAYVRGYLHSISNSCRKGACRTCRNKMDSLARRH